MSVLLFAYGTNMAASEMTAFCPQSRFLGPARLDGFRVEFRRRSRRWGGGAADIVEASGESVWGALYEVEERELDRLDEKEGAGMAYRRRIVTVFHDRRECVAQAYEVIEKEAVEVPPTLEYLALLEGGARDRGLPVPPLGWPRNA